MMRTHVLAGMGIGLMALCAPLAMHPPVQVIYNPSDSVPRGWYRIEAIADINSLLVGSIVLAQLPDDTAAFAAQRGYLPAGIPILKRIGAMAPQSVCIRSHVVRIDGEVAATARRYDGVHRPLQAWTQCRCLVEDELFLLSDTNPSSFDSRYFGPILASAVLGVARPIWIWSTP